MLWRPPRLVLLAAGRGARAAGRAPGRRAAPSELRRAVSFKRQGRPPDARRPRWGALLRPAPLVWGAAVLGPCRHAGAGRGGRTPGDVAPARGEDGWVRRPAVFPAGRRGRPPAAAAAWPLERDNPFWDGPCGPPPGAGRCCAAVANLTCVTVECGLPAGPTSSSLTPGILFSESAGRLFPPGKGHWLAGLLRGASAAGRTPADCRPGAGAASPSFAAARPWLWFYYREYGPAPDGPNDWGAPGRGC